MPDSRPEDAAWRARAGVENADAVLAALEAERVRLDEKLGAARARLAAAEQRLAEQRSRLRHELEALTRQADAELARLEDEHRTSLGAVRSAADDEARRVVDAARAGWPPAPHSGPPRDGSP